MPIRPIVSSINSLVSGCEEFLFNIIKPLELKCTFSINSTKHFKEVFLKNRAKFNPKTFEIMSYDARSLYTYTNIKQTVNFIINEIYKNPKSFFNEGSKEVNGTLREIPVPPKLTFKKFITAVLTKFNSFSSVNGFYTQNDGLSMGSKLSPLISNFYCNLMEQKIIKKWQNQNKIVMYVRYVDDICVVLKKGLQNQLLKEMNSFDKGYLKFTVRYVQIH